MDKFAPHSRWSEPSTKAGSHGRPQLHSGFHVGFLYGHKKHLTLSFSGPVERHAEESKCRVETVAQ